VVAGVCVQFRWPFAGHPWREYRRRHSRVPGASGLSQVRSVREVVWPDAMRPIVSTSQRSAMNAFVGINISVVLIVGSV
jgi:hypothetical protein